MIREAYVSFEVAKLLKEKGFNERTLCYYISNGEIRESMCPAPWNNGVMEPIMICAPTQQKAMAWLREKGIECVVIPIWNTLGKQYRSYALSDLGNTYKNNYDSYSDNISYEEAVEAALKYILKNLI